MKRIVTSREVAADYRFAATPDYNELAKNLSTPDGGFSVHPLTGASPTKQYMVAQPGAEQEIPAGQATPEALANHYKQNAGAFNDPDTFHGGWTDPNSMRSFLDVSKQFDNYDEAMQEAKRNNQLAIYDNSAQKSIPVEGNTHD